MAASLPRKLAFSFITLVLATGFVLVVGEAMVRLSGYRTPGTYDENGAYVDTLTTGAEHGPFGRIRGRVYHVDFDVPWVTNEHGFRERDRVPKAEGEWRIGLFGDSLMAGYGIEREERMGDLWFEAVRDSLPGVTLWNFGANHSGAHHQAEFLAGAGREYELDEIILGLYSGNEAQDNRRWQRANAPDRVQRGGRAKRSGFRRWLIENSSLAKLVWMNVAAHVMHRFSRTDTPRVQQFDGDQETIRVGLEHFRRAVDGRPFTLWYVPARFEWDDEHWQFTVRQYGISDEQVRYRLRDGVRQWAEEASVPFLDLTPALAGQPAERIRFPIDGHYTAEGHRLMADWAVEHGRSPGTARVAR